MTDPIPTGPSRCLIGLSDRTDLPTENGHGLTWHCFGMEHQIQVYGEQRARLRKLCQEMRQISLDVERCVGRQPGNELDVLNDFGAAARVRVSPTLYALLLTAKHLWRQTHEAYEPVMDQPTRSLWPSTRRLSPFRRLELDPHRGTARIRGERIRLDLSDLGIGWLHDRFLQRAGRERIRSGLLTSGEHHVTALGPPPFDDTWPLEITADLTPRKRLRVPLRFASGVLTVCRRAARLEDDESGEAWTLAVATKSGLEGVAFARSAGFVTQPESLAELASRLGGRGVWLARRRPEGIEAYRPLAE